MFLNEDHLRITKIRTVDGIMPVFGEDGKPAKKVIFAPNTKDARKLFDDQNTRLPNQLKMTIEKFDGYRPEPAGDPQVLEMQKRIAELEAQNKQLLNGHSNMNGSETSNGSEVSEKPIKKSK